MLRQLPPIIDGFTLNPAVRYRPGYIMALALGSLDVLRRANTYRPKLHIVPDDINQPIAAFETVEYQVRVVPNSYVWGLIFNQYHEQNWSAVAATDTWIQITDACNGIQFFDDFVSGQLFTSLQNVVTDQRNASLPHLLTQPRLILEPGLLNVEIANTATGTRRCQLVIFTAEPCELGAQQ